jgi:anti-sigma B factor antagonist
MDRLGQEPDTNGSVAARDCGRGCVVVARAVTRSARARRAARSRRAALAVISSYVRSARGIRPGASADGQALQVRGLPVSEGTARIRVAGEVDLATIGILRDAIARALAERPDRLVLDLAGVTFADSQLVHALEDARRSMGERRSDVRVVRATRAVMRLLVICDLDHLCADAA